MSEELNALDVCAVVIKTYETVLSSNEPDAAQLRVKLLEPYSFAIRQRHKRSVAMAKAERMKSSKAKA